MNGTQQPRYFHGGARGRKRGDMLRPSRELGIESHADHFPQYSDERIYFSEDIREAAVFARKYVSPEARRAAEAGEPPTAELLATCGGAVYQIEPIGDIEDDPDARQPGLWRCVPGARVVRVIAAHVEYGTGIILKSSDPSLLGTAFEPSYLERIGEDRDEYPS